MAYKVNSKRAFSDTVKINGRKFFPLIIKVNVSVDALVSKAKPAVDAMTKAGKAYSASGGDTQENFKAFSDSIDGVFKIIFGEKNYKKVLAYYDGEYLEMVSDLMPFIRDNVSPAIQKSLSDSLRE